jgi:hypothetical protein
VTETTLPSLNGHDGVVGLDDGELEGVAESVSDSVVDVNLPLTLGNTSGLGVVDGVNTSGKVELSGSLLASGDWGSA